MEGMLPSGRCELLSYAVRNTVAASDLDRALEELIRPFRERYDLWRAALGVFSSERHLRVVAAWSAGENLLDVGTEVDTRLTPTTERLGAELRNGRAQIIDVDAADLGLITEVFREQGIRSMIVIPLRDGERLVGVFSLGSTRANAFDDGDERLFTGVAAGVGPRMQALIGASGRA